MLAYTRELIMDKLLELAAIQSGFDETSQIEDAIAWLTEMHEDFGKIRHYLASSASNTRSSIQSAWDGHRKEGTDKSVPLRKARKIAVRINLVELGEILSNELINLDEKFDLMSDKIAQLLAAASAISPLPTPSGDFALWKRNVWIELGKHESTKAIYTYLTSSLNKSDREYLLESMLGRLADNNA